MDDSCVYCYRALGRGPKTLVVKPGETVTRYAHTACYKAYNPPARMTGKERGESPKGNPMLGDADDKSCTWCGLELFNEDLKELQISLQDPDDPGRMIHRSCLEARAGRKTAEADRGAAALAGDNTPCVYCKHPLKDSSEAYVPVGNSDFAHRQCFRDNKTTRFVSPSFSGRHDANNCGICGHALGVAQDIPTVDFYIWSNVSNRAHQGCRDEWCKSHGLYTDSPDHCCYCGEPLGQGTRVGAGDGSGHRFAHRGCWNVYHHDKSVAVPPPNAASVDVVAQLEQELEKTKRLANETDKLRHELEAKLNLARAKAYNERLENAARGWVAALANQLDTGHALVAQVDIRPPKGWNHVNSETTFEVRLTSGETAYIRVVHRHGAQPPKVTTPEQRSE